MAAEIAAGLVAGSLALLADAGHLLTDAAGLAFALVAAAIAGRPARGRWTLAAGRVGIPPARVAGRTPAAAGIRIVYGAVTRGGWPPRVRGGIVLAVALAGIAVNLVATLVLSRAGRESLNVRGAF